MQASTVLLATWLLFPRAGLEDRVAFWRAVMSDLDEHHLVFHDRTHVHIVYAVVDLRQLGIGDSQRSRRNSLEEEIRAKIRATLGEIRSEPRNRWSADASKIQVQLQRTGLSVSDLDPDAIHVQRGIRTRFLAGLERFEQYRTLVESTLRDEGVPLELAALPLVESSYLNVARSKAGAAGIWQFMPATARAFMRVDPGLDERLDPAISTRAAARFLNGNFRALGSWPLAIAAYNHGRAGIRRAKAECGPDLPVILRCYRGPAFGYASQNFYAEFLAALDLLNEHLRQPTLLAADIRPAVRYTIRRGETLSHIARRFGTTPERLAAHNRLRNPNYIRVGQVIEVQ